MHFQAKKNILKSNQYHTTKLPLTTATEHDKKGSA